MQSVTSICELKSLFPISKRRSLLSYISAKPHSPSTPANHFYKYPSSLYFPPSFFLSSPSVPVSMFTRLTSPMKRASTSGSSLLIARLSKPQAYWRANVAMSMTRRHQSSSSSSHGNDNGNANTTTKKTNSDLDPITNQELPINASFELHRVDLAHGSFFALHRPLLGITNGPMFANNNHGHAHMLNDEDFEGKFCVILSECVLSLTVVWGCVLCGAFIMRWHIRNFPFRSLFPLSLMRLSLTSSQKDQLRPRQFSLVFALCKAMHPASYKCLFAVDVLTELFRWGRRERSMIIFKLIFFVSSFD
jgi:hypothetical protein